MPFDDFRETETAAKPSHKKGRPRIDPAAPLTDAERAARYHAKHKERINRQRRLRDKVAALLNGKPAEAVAHQRRIRAGCLSGWQAARRTTRYMLGGRL